MCKREEGKWKRKREGGIPDLVRALGLSLPPAFSFCARRRAMPKEPVGQGDNGECIQNTCPQQEMLFQMHKTPSGLLQIITKCLTALFHLQPLGLPIKKRDQLNHFPFLRPKSSFRVTSNCVHEKHFVIFITLKGKGRKETEGEAQRSCKAMPCSLAILLLCGL